MGSAEPTTRPYYARYVLSSWVGLKMLSSLLWNSSCKSDIHLNIFIFPADSDSNQYSTLLIMRGSDSKVFFLVA